MYIPQFVAQNKYINKIKTALLPIGFIVLSQSRMVYADEADDAIAMFDGVVNVVCSIVMIIGALFCIVGIVKLAIAHAENQGPEQQKASMMLATGIVLCILPMIIKSGTMKAAFHNIIRHAIDV